MDKKNFTSFLIILVIMIAIVGTKTINQEVNIEVHGKPVVRPPFHDDEYNITINENEIIINISQNIVKEYEGRFLSVYAYDEYGNHISKLKRVINGKITINKNEISNYKAIISNDVVLSIEMGDKNTSFYQILKDAMDNGRYFGLERCLLGMQCIKICPVSAVEVLVRDTSPDGRGRIIPHINNKKCIHGGLCTTTCPNNLIILEKNGL